MLLSSVLSLDFDVYILVLILENITMTMVMIFMQYKMVKTTFNFLKICNENIMKYKMNLSIFSKLSL